MSGNAGRLVVGISGANEVVYGTRALLRLRELGIETHLVVTRAGEMTRSVETELSAREVREIADVSYSPSEVGAVVASGSFPTMGMLVAPCSMRTLSEIAYGATTNLLTRAADVTLKERRRLVLMVREMPLSLVHLQAMTAVTEAGAVVAPPVSALYTRPASIEETAPLFTNITGYQGSGFKVLGAPDGLSGPAHPLARVALSLGLPATATGREIVDARDRPGIPPRTVPAEEAPCKQNILRSRDVDLTRFPTPRIHANDGGRYLQTYGMNIVRTPDGSWTNWSINRMMIAGKDRLACLIPPPQHMGIIRAKRAALGQPTPIVTALGVEPGLPMVGGMPLPEGADESHFLGALLGEPVEVTTAETVDLPVPANEIVIEGHILPEKTAMEGPMNEYPGYNATEKSPKPVFLVGAITYRDGAVLPVVAAGPPVEEDHTVTGTMHAAELLYQLRRASLPVTTTWVILESAFIGWSSPYRRSGLTATGGTPASSRDRSARPPSPARPASVSPRCSSLRTTST